MCAVMLASGLACAVASTAYEENQLTTIQRHILIVNSMTCLIAAYHYRQLENIVTSAAHSGLKHTAPTRADIEEMQFRCSIVRYGDWVVTLPLLALDVALGNCVGDGSDCADTDAALKTALTASICLVVVVLLGSLQEFSSDFKLSRLTLKPWTVFAVACVFLGVAVYYLMEPGDEQGVYTYFILPWFAYGLFAAFKAFVRLPFHFAAVDIVYGTLDMWSKAGLALVTLWKFSTLHSTAS